ncbi:MAG: hypothetical protein ACRDT0_19470 [Pseudonocardiaceae bacterium]
MRAQHVVALGMLAVGFTLAAGFALVDGGDGLVAGFTVAFLAVAPAIAVAMPLRGLDPLARTVLALAAAAVVNALVAEAMLATDTWSIPGGVAAVGVVSAVVAAAAGDRGNGVS